MDLRDCFSRFEIIIFNFVSFVIWIIINPLLYMLFTRFILYSPFYILYILNNN